MLIESGQISTFSYCCVGKLGHVFWGHTSAITHHPSWIFGPTNAWVSSLPSQKLETMTRIRQKIFYYSFPSRLSGRRVASSTDPFAPRDGPSPPSTRFQERPEPKPRKVTSTWSRGSIILTTYLAFALQNIGIYNVLHILFLAKVQHESGDYSNAVEG